MFETNFSLGSFPIAIAFQSSNLFKTLIALCPNISKPLEEFSLPEKIIILSFLEIFLDH